MSHKHSRALAAVALGLSALLVAGCAQTASPEAGKPAAPGGSSGGPITIGTTDKVTMIDPAGSYDNGSFFVMNQVYGFLLNTAPGTTDMTPQPDLAESAEFTDPNTSR